MKPNTMPAIVKIIDNTTNKPPPHRKQTKKQEREASFARDIIDLRGLPDRVVTKARAIIAALGENKNYRDFGGKRLRHNRLIVSIPVGRHYRMLCEDCGTFLIPQKVLSHEDYNVCKPGS